MATFDNLNMPVERWKEACKAACSDINYRSHNGMTETRDDYFVDGVQWADEHPIKEPVSEDLEEAAFDYAEACKYDGGEKLLCVEHFKAGAQWQKEQMMKKAFPVEIGRQRSDYKCVLHGNFSNCDTGDKVKVIITKED